MRKIFIHKIRDVCKLQARDEIALSECRRLLADNRAVGVELTRRIKENAAVVELKNKLHEICKLQQKQNKDIIEESERMSESEKLKMEEIAMRFNETVLSITERMAEQQEKHAAECVENEELTKKLKQLEEHEKLRNEHFSAQAKAKGLELQLYAAKNEQKRQALLQEKNKGDAYRAHAEELIVAEKEMKAQLSLYAEKFSHFQEALTRSNSMFSQFKTKMDEMDTTIKRLQDENDSLKKSCSEYDSAIMGQVRKKLEYIELTDSLVKRKSKLEKKCRRLQTERGALAEQLRARVPQAARPNGATVDASMS